MSSQLHCGWDGESHPTKGWRAVAIIRERGERTRKLRSKWRREPNEQGAWYLGRMELERRLVDERNAGAKS